MHRAIGQVWPGRYVFDAVQDGRPRACEDDLVGVGLKLAGCEPAAIQDGAKRVG